MMKTRIVAEQTNEKTPAQKGRTLAEKICGKALLKTLESYQMDIETIRYVACSDMEDEYSFADGFVILSAEKLVIVRYTADNVPRSFGGYVREQRGTGNPAIKIYELGTVDELEVLRHVSSGELLGKIDGVEYRLAHFSNSRMGEFLRLKDALMKVKKGEDLSKEDVEGSKKQECCPNCGTLYPDQERKVCPKCMDKKSIFLRLFGYFKGYKAQIAVMCLCYVVSAVLTMVYPYLSGTILYDRVLAKDEAFLKLVGLPGGRFVTLLLAAVLAMFVSKILIQAAGILHGYLTSQMVPEVVGRLKSEVFSSMGRLSISFYNSRQTGGLMTRVLDDASEITSFFIDGVPYFIVNVLTVIMTAVIMFKINAILAVVSLLLLPVMMYMSYHMMPRLWSFYGKRHRASKRLNSQINDNITGARVVKAFGKEDEEMKRFARTNAGVREAELAVAAYDNRFNILYNAGENLTNFAVWGIGAALVLSNTHLELGVLITFTGYVSQLNGPLDFMSYMFRWFTNCMNASQRVFEIIDAVPQVKEAEHPAALSEVSGNIRLEHVTFGYEPNKPILKDLSFEVQPGQMLGIVGRSGAGKSTLVNLISRLYDPDEGNIYLDGVDIRKLSFEQLRKSIAMVSQETYVFMGTVAENITYARPNASRAEIIRAAKLASAHDFICKMPEGYDTLIGSSGRSLSGGERQRLSIARAILADPKILILDEATAAVDTETEAAIGRSLELLVKGRTTLSIAHRLSTLKDADFLVVIDEGKLAEEGTHAELIEKKGIYYKLMELQTKALAMRGLED
jgi:ATP-binding cassette subfamily B protein